MLPRPFFVSCFKNVYSKFQNRCFSSLEKIGAATSTELHGVNWEKVGCAVDKETDAEVRGGVEVYQDFVTSAEEEQMMKEIEPQFKRLRYETAHWDDAIQGFREIERKDWSPGNQSIIERMKKVVNIKDCTFLKHTHILDLSATGVIKPHVDSVKFCGSHILGLCILSSCVMRFRRQDSPHKYADVLLPRYCLYVMKNQVRYDYTHEVLSGADSMFRGQQVEKGRRLSVLLRTQHDNSNVDSYSYKT